MPWTQLTTTEALKGLNQSEVDAYSDAKGQDDFDDNVAQAIARVRVAILAGGGAVHPTADYIPDGLHGECIAIARWRFLVSLPRNEELQTPERKELHDDAIDLLAEIEKGNFTIESPGDQTGNAQHGASGGVARIPMRTEPSS